MTQGDRSVSKRTRCPGHARHWFSLYGSPGIRTPTCQRCGAPNPRPLEQWELDDLEALLAPPKRTITPPRAAR